MLWRKQPRTAVIENVAHLIGPGWEYARARVGHSHGGTVTLTVLSLRRVDDGTGMVELMQLPARLSPTDHLYSTRTYRGREVQYLASGALSISNPDLTAIDHLHITYVPKGGA